jgi:hypothetical protein
VVTSEWDTQIGKQLRVMDAMDNVEGFDQLFSSRIFSTEVGVRPAEPCSLSVVATHQLLTNLFEYIAALVLSDMRYSHAAAATISEQDLKILESKCSCTKPGLRLCRQTTTWSTGTFISLVDTKVMKVSIAVYRYPQ